MKAVEILLEALPVAAMILLIPLFLDDYLLTGIYFLIIALAFLRRHERNDWLFLAFGFFVMILSEAFFVATGVETFNRNSFLGLMPLWLPFLWGYAFVAMRRAIVILDRK